MCLLSALSFSGSCLNENKLVVFGLGFFCHFRQNARILIFSSFWKYIVYSALSQLISRLLFWNVLYGKTDCCLCIYHGILWCSICQLGFSLQSAKSSILVVSEINLHVCFFGLGFVLGLFVFVDFLFGGLFFFSLWKWSSRKHWLLCSFQTFHIFSWSTWLITCWLICCCWLSNGVNSFLIIGYCAFPFDVLLFYLTYYLSGNYLLITLFKAKGNTDWNTTWQTEHTMEIWNWAFLIWVCFCRSVGQSSSTQIL